MRDRLAALIGYPRQAWILAGVILLVTLSTGSTLTPILPDLKLYFGQTGTGVALIVSLLSLARLSVDLPAGFLLDRFSHKALLIGGMLLVVVGTALSASANVFAALLAGQLAIGVGVNTCMIAAMVMFSRASTEGTRGGLFGLYTAATLASSSVGPVVSGTLASALGWRSVFVFASLAAAVAALLTWLAVERDDKGSDEPSQPADQVEGEAALKKNQLSGAWSWAVPIYVIMFLLYLSSSGITHSALPIYANETLLLSSSAIGWAMGLAMLFRSVISVLGGKLGDRYGHRWVVTFGLVTIGVGFLALNRVTGFQGMLAVMLFISLGHIGTALPNAWLVSLSPKDRWGALLGISRFWADLAHVIGPVAILFVFDQWGFTVATLVGASLLWLAACVAVATVKRT